MRDNTAVRIGGQRWRSTTESGSYSTQECCKARYWVEEHLDSQGGIGKIEGRIIGDIDWFRLIGADVVLKLSDGRVWNCRLEDGGYLQGRDDRGLRFPDRA